jgi:hypothetical protein
VRSLPRKVEKPIRVYAYKDENGGLWWLLHPPTAFKRKGKGPIYTWEQWKLLKTITDISEAIAKPRKIP